MKPPRNPIVLIGGGGHCKSCIEVLEAGGLYTIQGVLEQPEKLGTSICGYPVIGTDADIGRLAEANHAFLISLGQLGSAALRKARFEELQGLGAELPAIISPFARVSAHARIGAGTIVMHGAIINAGAQVGHNCIVNTGAIIEHDVEVGPHSHLSTGALVNGNCCIGSEVFIGSRATLIQGLEVGNNIILGAGSLLLQSIHQPGTYVGHPAQLINR